MPRQKACGVSAELVHNNRSATADAERWCPPEVTNVRSEVNNRRVIGRNDAYDLLEIISETATGTILVTTELGELRAATTLPDHVAFSELEEQFFAEGERLQFEP